MTKFIVYNRTDTLKTDINLLFKIKSCQIVRLALVDASSRKLKFHVSVRLLTINLAHEPARISAIIVK